MRSGFMSKELTYDPVANVEKSSEYSRVNGIPEEGVPKQTSRPSIIVGSIAICSETDHSTVPLKTTFCGHVLEAENPPPFELVATAQANAASAFAERFFDIFES